MFPSPPRPSLFSISNKTTRSHPRSPHTAVLSYWDQPGGLRRPWLTCWAFHLSSLFSASKCKLQTSVSSPLVAFSWRGNYQVIWNWCGGLQISGVLGRILRPGQKGEDWWSAIFWLHRKYNSHVFWGYVSKAAVCWQHVFCFPWLF